MTMIMKASTEWSTRPADQRYSTVEDLHAACTRYRERARTAVVPFKALHATAVDGEVILNGRTDRTAHLTHWSFGQLAARAGAPAGYLRDLPAPLAADCINHGLATRTDGDGTEDKATLLFDVNGEMTARAITSDQYTRIWNADITQRLVALKAQGTWQEAPAAFDGSRGQYASDRDMFSFFVDNNRRIFETLPGGGLSRGFMVWNSEVGAAVFGIMAFLYEYICGNHRIWGASEIKEVRLRHVGNADEKAFAKMAVELREYAEGSATEDEAKILRARQYTFGASKEEVLDTVFGLRIGGLSLARIDKAYDLAVEREGWYGDPRSAWGLAGGLTEIARDLPHAEERVAVDRAAGKVMEVAF